ncbi:hypothetical protein CMI45_02145 [Candidatus Pacearchaeota archaeon]|nr:hypothetical protein [Candidatus Pacearchaeota archaeon]|tara:strand:- start:8482 stop:8853 length:372 start_codon:yes stop_codon:yes gene_type:complete
MEVLLDTNFIISCIKRKINFIEELGNLGFRIKIPLGVSQELKDLKKDSKVGRDGRVAIELAMQILDDRRVKKTRIGGRTVDEGLIQKGRGGAYIATLDRAIKREVPNRVVILSAKNSLSVERD